MEVKPGYKQTEVGVIPEEWEVKPLGSVLNRARLGGNYPNQDRETSYPLMKMGNIARGYIDLSKVEYVSPGVRPLPDDRLTHGDVLFNTRNTLELVGKVAVWRDELPVAYYNSNLMRLEFNPNEVCSNEYANYTLNSSGGIARLRALATGTTSVAAIYTRDLLKFPFIVPTLPEQSAIAGALSDVDALIGALGQLIAKKRDLKQAAMQQLLPGQTRLPGFHGVWEDAWLGDKALKIGSGITPTGGEKIYRREGRPFLRSQNVGWGVLLLDYIAFVDDDTHATFPATEVEVDDVFLNITGASIGRSAVADSRVTGGNVNQHVCIIRPNQTQLFPHFLNYSLLSTVGQRQIDSFQAGGNRQGLNFSQIRSMRFRLPPLPEQAAIAEVLSDLDAELAALEQRRDKTRALKQGMMQELLTGRTRLV